MNYKLFNSTLSLFIISLVTPLPAHAYAGPGVALGAAIVFLTVIFAFIASSFLSIVNFIRRIFSSRSSKDNKVSQPVDKEDTTSNPKKV